MRKELANLYGHTRAISGTAHVGNEMAAAGKKQHGTDMTG